MLRFPLADIPVRVHFSFLLIAVLSPSPRPVDIAAWTLMVFLAVLLHEVGHAVTARHYGATPVTITLFALGGVTVYPAKADLTPGRRFVIAAAGSLVGIVTGGLLGLLWLAGLFDGASQVVRVAAISYIFAGLGWGVLNWAPIRPLDGGAMLTSALEIVNPRRAVDIARVVSLICGVVASVVLFRFGQTFGAVFVLVITAMGMADERSVRAAPPPPAPQPSPDANSMEAGSPGAGSPETRSPQTGTPGVGRREPGSAGGTAPGSPGQGEGPSWPI